MRYLCIPESCLLVHILSTLTPFKHGWIQRGDMGSGLPWKITSGYWFLKVSGTDPIERQMDPSGEVRTALW